MGVIVVGVDNSTGADAALRFAFDEARLRHARLRVVHARPYGFVGAVSNRCANHAHRPVLIVRGSLRNTD